MPINTSGFNFSDNTPIQTGGGYQIARAGSLAQINPASFAVDLVSPYVSGIKAGSALLAPLAEGITKIADYYRPENVQQRDLESKERGLKGLQIESDTRLQPTMEELKKVTAEGGIQEVPLKLSNLQLDNDEKRATNQEMKDLRSSGVKQMELQAKIQDVKNQADLVKIKADEVKQAATMAPEIQKQKAGELKLAQDELAQKQKEHDQMVKESESLGGRLNLSFGNNETGGPSTSLADAQTAAVLARTHKGTTPDFWLKSLTAARGGSDGLSEDQKKVGNSLFKDFYDNPTVKNYAVSSAAMNSLSELADPKVVPTAQNDMAIIFSYMKILDPNSTVREGEYATAQNAGSVPENIRKQFNKAMDGTLLNPKDRSNFIVSAKRAFTGQQKNYDRIRTQYGDQAERNKLPRDFVVGKDESNSGDSGSGKEEKIPTITTVAEREKLGRGAKFIYKGKPYQNPQ